MSASLVVLELPPLDTLDLAPVALASLALPPPDGPPPEPAPAVPDVDLRTWASLLFERAKECGVAHPVFELRLLATQFGTVSGYFDSLEALAEAVERWEALAIQRESIYCTLNPVVPDLLARANNKTKKYAKTTTDDTNIAQRILLPFDFDPDRPTGISSNDCEHDAAIAVAGNVRDWLSATLGWPDALVGDSGNGAHLVYAIDLPNEPASTNLIERCLAAVKAQFQHTEKTNTIVDPPSVIVDTSIGNAARIWKIYGTTAKKGDSTAERPHRIARILSIPPSKRLDVVPRDALEALAVLAPEGGTPSATAKAKKGKKASATSGKTTGANHEPDLDVPAWLAAHGLIVTKTKPYTDGGTLWELACCPMDPAHANGAASVIKFPSGVVTARCLHDGCAGKGWRDWREKVGDSCPPQEHGTAGPAKYTDAEIEGFANSQCCSVEEFRLRWIIQRATAFYVLVDGKYLSPLLKGELPASLEKRDLARVPNEKESPAGIDWEEELKDEKGTVIDVRHRSIDEMIGRYATVARKVVATMLLPASRYDPASQTFYEAICPLRPIAPAFDAQIDRWLRLLGGTSADKLLDWIATAPRLDRVTCALYLHGKKDCGKTMLAMGLARLWGQAPTELKSLTGNFNGAILNCPLVLADEEVPQNMTSGFIRSLVGNASRTLRRKYMQDAELHGAVRLIIAGNNADLFKFDDEDFSVDDIEAVAARILYIRPAPEAADYLRSLGGRQGTEGWVEDGDKIAAHALWLRDHRDVQPGNRFLVEGTLDTLHRRIATHGSIRGLVIEWICRAMYVKKWERQHPGIQFGAGKLYVNTSFVKEKWEAVLNDNRVPSLKKIGAALKPLSCGEKRMAYGSRRADFYDIDPTYVYETARDLQIGTPEEFAALIEAPRAYLDTADSDSAPPALARTAAALASPSADHVIDPTELCVPLKP